MKTFAPRPTTRAWALPALLLMLGVVAFPQSATAQDIDLTGDWVFTVQSPNGTGERSVTFVQEGTELSGEIASAQAAGPLSGTIEGDKVTFVAVVQMDSGPFDITYTATIADGEMTGTVEFGSYGSGTFRGRRAEGSTERQKLKND